MPNSPTPNMSLVMPTEGSDSGVWDTSINAAADLLDSHNHTAGRGVQIPTTGISLDADLTFTKAGTAYAAKDVKAIDFAPSATSGMTAYAGALFCNSADNELYWRTTSGSNVKVTNGAALNVGAFTGGIGGDYAAIPAECNFVDASKTYTFKSTAAGNWSRLQAGAMRISEFGTTESTYVELACPAALAGTYTVTFPTAAPGSTSIVQMSSAGVLTASNTVANAVTLSSTLTAAAVNPTTITASGLITAQAGLTASANQHVTVSGTGDVKHGNRTMVVSASEGQPLATSSFQGDKWTLAAADQIVTPIQLRIGKRVRSIVAWYKRAGGTVTFQLTRTAMSSGTVTSVANTTSASGTTRTSITLSSIDHTILSTDQYYFLYVAGAVNDEFYGLEVTYDNP